MKRLLCSLLLVLIAPALAEARSSSEPVEISIRTSSGVCRIRVVSDFRTLWPEPRWLWFRGYNTRMFLSFLRRHVNGGGVKPPNPGAADYKRRVLIALDVLMQSAEVKALPVLRLALQDKDRDIRAKVIGALGALGDQEDIETLEDMIKNEADPWIVYAVASALVNRRVEDGLQYEAISKAYALCRHGDLESAILDLMVRAKAVHLVPQVVDSIRPGGYMNTERKMRAIIALTGHDFSEEFDITKIWRSDDVADVKNRLRRWWKENSEGLLAPENQSKTPSGGPNVTLSPPEREEVLLSESDMAGCVLCGQGK